MIAVASAIAVLTVVVNMITFSITDEEAHLYA